MLRIAIFILLILAGPWVFAEAAEKLTINGSARVRSEFKNNADFTDSSSDYTDSIGSRFRLDMRFIPRDDLRVFFQPQFTKIWGQANWVPSGAAANTETVSSGGTRDSEMSVHQAYVAYAPSAPILLTLGRKELNYGDQLLVGGLGWSHVGRAFDLISAEYKHDLGSIEIFNAKVDDNNASSAGAGDKEFSGLYLTNNLSGYTQALDGYVLLSSDRSTDPRSKTTAYGLRSKSPVGDFDYRAEATFESVKTTTTDSDEHQYDVEVGYSIIENARLRVAAEYFLASKYFDSFYPTGHKWLGYADQFARKNIKGFRVGLSGKLAEKWTASVDYHNFERVDTDVTAFPLSGPVYGTVGNDSAVATEIDLIVGYKVHDDLALEGGAAHVMPGDYLKANGKSDNTSFYYLQASANF